MKKKKVVRKRRPDFNNRSVRRFSPVRENEKPYSSDSRIDLVRTRQALSDAFVSAGADGVMEFVRAYYDTLSVEEGLNRAKLKRRTFFHALSKGSNPTLSTLMQLIKGMDL